MTVKKLLKLFKVNRENAVQERKDFFDGLASGVYDVYETSDAEHIGQIAGEISALDDVIIKLESFIEKEKEIGFDKKGLKIRIATDALEFLSRPSVSVLNYQYIAALALEEMEELDGTE